MQKRITNREITPLRIEPTFKEKLLTRFPQSRILDDRLSLSSVAVDASLYRVEPLCIVDVISEVEMAFLMKVCIDSKIPLTFRAAGTSLSGQAQGAGVLARMTRGFKNLEVLDRGEKIRLGVGVIGAQANHALLNYSKKLGPDPASLHSCMVGGIVANNASGMCCGTHQNTYQTLSSIRFILPPSRAGEDALLVDTGSFQSRDRCRSLRPELLAGLLKIRGEILSDQPLKLKIQNKYRIKNTMGYGLNSFLDFEDPIDILSHLLVGSEGTLGFVSEIIYNTVPDPKEKACAFIVFPSLTAACESILEIKELKLSAAEIMDRAALRSVENQKDVPAFLKTLPKQAAALLIETRADDPQTLLTQVQAIETYFSGLEFSSHLEFSFDSVVYEKWWNVRRGLFPSVARGRKPGTTVIIEDVAVPLAVLPEATEGLEHLLSLHGYQEAVIFGHALDGNLHFVFTQDFSNPKEIDRYEAFMHELSEKVIDRWQGSLKAEHGTGRNMAPFLEKEWGVRATEIMWQIKALIDPVGLLNPDVILSRNSRIHLESIKNSPAIHSAIDDCMDCGFCESHCPSVALTITPRQRIAAFREAKRTELPKTWVERFSYEIDQTCATDGLCGIACPVGIDTGSWIKKMRSEKRNSKFLQNGMALIFARTMGVWFGLLSLVFLIRGQFKANPKLKRLIQASKQNSKQPSDSNVIFIPSCISRFMTRSLPDTMLVVLEKAGYNVLVPSEINDQCCGLPFESKGYTQASEYKITQLNEVLLEISRFGEIPIISDTSPCSLQMQKKLDSRLQIYDSVKFIHQFILSGKSPIPVVFQKNAIAVAIHSTCSAKKMELDHELHDLAQACATDVVVPTEVECCGFAGDKGWTYPELTASALRNLAGQVKGRCEEGFSTSPTCEVGLSRVSGVTYRSIIYAVAHSVGAKVP